MGAPPVAESSDLSEWPRSASEAAAPSATRVPSIATGTNVWAAVRLRFPACALARTPALHTGRGTHYACAVSATGSAQARDHTEGPRRLFAYFLTG